MSADALVDKETQKKLESMELSQRSADSLSGRAVYWLGIVFALAHIYFNTIGTLSELWVSAIHFGGFALLCSLMVPMTRSASHRGGILIIDLIIGLIAVGTTVYLILMENALYDRGVHFITSDWIAACLAIVVALELTRRTTGWFIPCLIVSTSDRL